MHYLLSIYFSNEPLHLLSRVTAHHQEVLLDVTLATYCPLVKFYANDDSFILNAQPECPGPVQVSCLFLH